MPPLHLPGVSGCLARWPRSPGCLGRPGLRSQHVTAGFPRPGCQLSACSVITTCWAGRHKQSIPTTHHSALWRSPARPLAADHRHPANAIYTHATRVLSRLPLLAGLLDVTVSASEGDVIVHRASCTVLHVRFQARARSPMLPYQPALGFAQAASRSARQSPIRTPRT